MQGLFKGRGVLSRTDIPTNERKKKQDSGPPLEMNEIFLEV